VGQPASVWQARDGTRVRATGCSGLDVVISPDGHFLAAGAQDQVRRLTLTTAPTTTAAHHHCLGPLTGPPRPTTRQAPGQARSASYPGPSPQGQRGDEYWHHPAPVPSRGTQITG
jgi:hypothetical protein